jgi:hypothetical protein
MGHVVPPVVDATRGSARLTFEFGDSASIHVPSCIARMG